MAVLHIFYMNIFWDIRVCDSIKLYRPVFHSTPNRKAVKRAQNWEWTLCKNRMGRSILLLFGSGPKGSNGKSSTEDVFERCWKCENWNSPDEHVQLPIDGIQLRVAVNLSNRTLYRSYQVRRKPLFCKSRGIRRNNIKIWLQLKCSRK